MKSQNLQKGSAHLIIIIVLAVVVLGLLGFVFWQNFVNTDDSNQSQTAQDESSTNPDLPETYTSEFARFTIKHPSDWTLIKKVVNDEDPVFSSEGSSLTSPSGTVLTLRADNGGRGGTCGAAAGDEPFSAGNACSSQEFLSIEKLSIENVYERTNVPNNFDTEKVSVYLITKRYASTDGVSSYVIGVINDSQSVAPTVNSPVMGSLSKEPFISNSNEAGIFQPYIYIYATSDSEDFLESADVQVIKEIIRSLRINN